MGIIKRIKDYKIAKKECEAAIANLDAARNEITWIQLSNEATAKKFESGEYTVPNNICRFAIMHNEPWAVGEYSGNSYNTNIYPCEYFKEGKICENKNCSKLILNIRYFQASAEHSVAQRKKDTAYKNIWKRNR